MGKEFNNYKLQELEFLEYACPYCNSEKEISSNQGSPFIIDGDSILFRGISESIGYDETTETLWDYGYLFTSSCSQCEKISIVIQGTLIAKNGTTGTRLYFNEYPGEEKIFKVVCDINNQNVSNFEFLPLYGNKWLFFEYSTNTISPMQNHFFGPFQQASNDGTSQSPLDLGANILKEIWPTLVDLCAVRQKLWESSSL